MHVNPVKRSGVERTFQQGSSPADTDTDLNRFLDPDQNQDLITINVSVVYKGRDE